jgi:nucleoside-diphosphate-sugar epimerase
MKLLVTGGLGFIGSNFIEYMMKNYPEIQIINVDKCDYCARIDNVDGNLPQYTLVLADITDKQIMKEVFRLYEPTHVVHFAAQSFVDLSFEQSFQFTRDNVLGTHVLLETVRNYGRIQKFIHVSTDEVYGEVDGHVTCDESAALNPMNPYAASKAAAELYVKAYTKCYNLPCIITRGNNVFGPKQYPEKVVPIFIDQILEGRLVTIHGTGEMRRNFIHVSDVCRAVDVLLQKGVVGETYNIGTKFEYSILEMYKMLADISGVFTQTKCVPDPRPHNDSRYCIDSSKLNALGWKEDQDFETKLKETFEWYKSLKGEHVER